MTNPYGSPDPGAAGNEPTQPFWPGPDPRAADPAGGEFTGAAGFAGPGDQPRGPFGPAASQAPAFGEHLKRDRHKALRWTMGLVVVALLAGGGAIAAWSLTGHLSGAAQSQASAAQQGALLNSTLNSAGSAGGLTSTSGATTLGGAGAPNGTQAGAAAHGGAGSLCARARRVARAAGRAGLPRLARRIQAGAQRCGLVRHRVLRFLLLRGVEGQFTIQTRQGTKTLAYERGVIQSVDAGKSLVVKASDGTTWTWDLVSTTVIRDKQGKVSQSTLTAGTPVWVGGPVVQNTKDARLIVLRPPQPALASPSPTPSS
jgi:hypothetical protein